MVFTDCPNIIDQGKNICAFGYDDEYNIWISDEQEGALWTIPTGIVFAKPGDAITFEYADCTLPSPDLDNEDCLYFALRAKMSEFKTTEPIDTEPVTAIPEWIKNNAGWWAEGQIDDSSFLQGIQFLIKEGIMVIPPTVASESSGSGVPVWVKNNAGWWAEGQIDDNSFVSGIQYLVKAGIIQVG